MVLSWLLGVIGVCGLFLCFGGFRWNSGREDGSGWTNAVSGVLWVGCILGLCRVRVISPSVARVGGISGGPAVAGRRMDLCGDVVMGSSAPCWHYIPYALAITLTILLVLTKWCVDGLAWAMSYHLSNVF